MKISVELKDLLVNNALTTIVHFVLMVVLLPLNILFPILLPIFIGIYIWCGYKWMLPTRHANYLSVLLITLVLLTLVVTLLATGTFASYQIATWLSVWSLAVSLLAGLAFPSLFWSEGQEVLTMLGKIASLLGAFVPAAFFLLGMRLREKRDGSR